MIQKKGCEHARGFSDKWNMHIFVGNSKLAN